MKKDDRLSLVGATAMAIGGMIGGGIFAVLGEATASTGNAAFLAFGLAGVLAYLTGVSYVRLTLLYDDPGGVFSFLRHAVGMRSAGAAAWFLIVGYLFTISLYAYTFGSYTALAFGISSGWGPWLGLLVIGFLVIINLRGVHTSGLTEIVLVIAKLALLAGLVAIGFLAVNSENATPVLEHSSLNILGAAALLFVAFEGFQLLAYNYAVLKNPRRNLGRAIRFSIVLVTLLYMAVAFVTTGSLDDATIQAEQETVLATLAKPTLGIGAVIAVGVMAAVSTASAIHATLFATARLADDVIARGQLPKGLAGRHQGGVPVTFLLLLAAVSAVVQFFGTLRQIVFFASLVFLLVFALVNGIALKAHAFKGWGRVGPLAGALGCLAAAGLLVVDTAQADWSSVWIAGAVAALLGVAKLWFDRVAVKQGFVA